MTILVTGAAGFIASHLVDAYLSAGHQVVAVDDLSVGKSANLNPSATFIEIDIRDLSALKKLFNEHSIDIINHHAAQKFLRRSVEFPTEDAEINILGSLNLLICAAEQQVKQFIFPSTATVYGDSPDNLPYQEGFVGQPIAPYSAAKLSVEHYLGVYRHTTGLKTATLRYSNVYGPRQDAHGESGVIAILSEKLLKGEQPIIFGDGLQTRDYVYVSDIVKANLLATEKEFDGVVNISSASEISLLDVYTKLSQLTGVSISPSHQPAKKGDPYRLVLANKKAADILGWRPMVSFDEGLKMTVDWFKRELK